MKRTLSCKFSCFAHSVAKMICSLDCIHHLDIKQDKCIYFGYIQNKKKYILDSEVHNHCKYIEYAKPQPGCFVEIEYVLYGLKSGINYNNTYHYEKIKTNGFYLG